MTGMVLAKPAPSLWVAFQEQSQGNGVWPQQAHAIRGDLSVYMKKPLKR